MKFKASFLFLALLVGSATSVSAEQQLFRSVTNEYVVDAGHVRSFTSDVYIEDIPKSPKWADSDAQPPLPARRAMRIAQEYVTDLLGGYSLFSQMRVFSAITDSITIVSVPRQDTWMYIVKVVPLHPGTGNVQTFDVVVFMDGTIPRYVERKQATR